LLQSIERVRASQFLPSSTCDAFARFKYAMRLRSGKNLSTRSSYHNATFTCLSPGALMLYRYLIDFGLYGSTDVPLS